MGSLFGNFDLSGLQAIGDRFSQIKDELEQSIDATIRAERFGGLRGVGSRRRAVSGGNGGAAVFTPLHTHMRAAVQTLRRRNQTTAPAWRCRDLKLLRMRFPPPPPSLLGAQPPPALPLWQSRRWARLVARCQWMLRYRAASALKRHRWLLSGRALRRSVCLRRRRPPPPPLQVQRQVLLPRCATAAR